MTAYMFFLPVKILLFYCIGCNTRKSIIICISLCTFGGPLTFTSSFGSHKSKVNPETVPRTYTCRTAGVNADPGVSLARGRPAVQGES